MAVTWRNQTDIKSASSSRVYVVAEQVINGTPTGRYGCSCPGWKGYGGQCKHLASMGLPSCRERTRPAPRGAGKGGNHAFTDSAFAHYDTAGGYGTAEEWIRLAERLARGRGRYQRPGRHVPSNAEDLALLNLTAMPDDAKELVRAMRRQAQIDHPDHGGDPEKFKAMFAAYERLLRYY